MRLGAYPCRVEEGTLAGAAYGKSEIAERHRHRYEFHNAYRDRLREHGVVTSGIYPEQDLVEIIEYGPHPWFVAVQFHPEFQSDPVDAHPLFREFVAASRARALGDERGGRSDDSAGGESDRVESSALAERGGS